MVNYYDFDELIWNVIKEIKKETGIEDESLPVRIREFEKNKLNLDTKDYPGDYPEFQGRAWILYLGDESENQDGFDKAWKNRLVVLSSNQDKLSKEALYLDMAKQFKNRSKNIEDKNLEAFVKGLENYASECYNI